MVLELWASKGTAELKALMRREFLGVPAPPCPGLFLLRGP